MIFSALAVIVAAYFLGSVNFAVIFTMFFTKKDVRNFGSGNAGSTNALRVGGTPSGVLTFVFDFLKGTAAAYLGRFAFEYLYQSSDSRLYSPVYGAYICGVACLIGHIFPLFFKFKGGKGVAAGAGIFIVICPVATAVGLGIFIIVFLISKTVSLGSIIGATALVITALILYDTSAYFLPQFVFAVILLLIIIVKHKDNIVRLIEGNENKFTFGGKK